ncbi:hypothetical protein SAMN05421548_11388 [Paraburkholderia lycopersici]|uniref:Uncharacterized protein n=1 Tax=Paraburkholderia lycopersici TaxID=416944 RepID=A0A1G6RD69_9BURK|nr:hypothetical protein SAMN05421548_11388 [Paraburkholderia lycopersici]
MKRDGETSKVSVCGRERRADCCELPNLRQNPRFPGRGAGGNAAWGEGLREPYGLAMNVDPKRAQAFASSRTSAVGVEPNASLSA